MLAPALILTTTAALILLAAAAQALLATEDVEEAWGDVPNLPRGAREATFRDSDIAKISIKGE